MQQENRIRGQDDFLNEISEVICELLVISGLCHASHIPAWSHCKTKRNGCTNAGLAMPKLHEDTSKNICRIRVTILTDLILMANFEPLV